MKKKLIAVLLAVATTICIIALSGCSSCLEFLFTFGRRPPKVSDIRESIYENWGIELPENMTLIYFANTLGPRGDGCVYYELACEQIDDDFALLLSDEKMKNLKKSSKVLPTAVWATPLTLIRRKTSPFRIYRKITSGLCLTFIRQTTMKHLTNRFAFYIYLNNKNFALQNINFNF